MLPHAFQSSSRDGDAIAFCQDFMKNSQMSSRGDFPPMQGISSSHHEAHLKDLSEESYLAGGIDRLGFGLF